MNLVIASTEVAMAESTQALKPLTVVPFVPNDGATTSAIVQVPLKDGTNESVLPAVLQVTSSTELTKNNVRRVMVKVTIPYGTFQCQTGCTSPNAKGEISAHIVLTLPATAVADLRRGAFALVQRQITAVVRTLISTIDAPIGGQMSSVNGSPRGGAFTSVVAKSGSTRDLWDAPFSDADPGSDPPSRGMLGLRPVNTVQDSSGVLVGGPILDAPYVE